MSSEPGASLPVHGFVLAGGRSSRMGQDKAMLPFRGTPMVAIAVAKLRSFCAEVSIAGNRDDLRPFAPVVHETRIETGPGAGIEAGLLACLRTWALFVPVDAPLVPAALLRRWAEVVLQSDESRSSYLMVHGRAQPAFCMMQRDCLPSVRAYLDSGERRLDALLDGVSPSAGSRAVLRWEADTEKAEESLQKHDLDLWFSNVNTPEDLTVAERL